MNRHIFKISLGIILVIIGLIGGLIPIFQGWMFGIPGLIILAFSNSVTFKIKLPFFFIIYFLFSSHIWERLLMQKNL